jgi:hypothetical protein
MKINEETLTQAQDKIKKMFLEQVQKGNQSKSLNNSNLLACGQFLNYLESNQRGLHGTAAALRVVSHYERGDTCKNAVKSLLEYAKSFVEIEKQQDSINEQSAMIDDNNIIKKAELLYSLSFIKSGTADCDDLIKKIAKELKDNQINNDSWTFFVNTENKEADIIPTSMSVLALHANNCDGYKTGRTFLLNEINKIIKEKIKDPETFSKIVLALYVLVFTTNGERELKENEHEYKNILKKIWSSNFAFMNSDIEQNIEYPYNTRHFYVRIPWQIYLLAISNRLSYWYSSKVSYFSRLHSILEQTNVGGFKYLYSGKHISSRTNAIVFDVLEHIKKSNKYSLITNFLNFYDKILNFLKGSVVKWCFNALAIIIIVYSTYQWINASDSSIKDFAPEFIACFVIFLFNFRPSNN